MRLQKVEDGDYTRLKLLYPIDEVFDEDRYREVVFPTALGE